MLYPKHAGAFGNITLKRHKRKFPVFSPWTISWQSWCLRVILWRRRYPDRPFSGRTFPWPHWKDTKIFRCHVTWNILFLCKMYPLDKIAVNLQFGANVREMWWLQFTELNMCTRRCCTVNLRTFSPVSLGRYWFFRNCRRVISAAQRRRTTTA